MGNLNGSKMGNVGSSFLSAISFYLLVINDHGSKLSKKWVCVYLSLCALFPSSFLGHLDHEHKTKETSEGPGFILFLTPQMGGGGEGLLSLAFDVYLISPELMSYC